MDPTDLLRHYGGHAETDLNLIGVLVLLAGTWFALKGKRQHALVSFILISFLMPMGQTIVVLGINFMLFRIMVLLLWVRIILLADYRGFQVKRVDKAVVWWVFAAVVTSCLLWMNWGATINRLGFLYDVLGSYFILRMLCRDTTDVSICLKTLAIVAIAVSISMTLEQATGRNLFAAFGGVPEFNRVREGRIRSQGPFAHALLAGTYGAAVFPLSMSLLWQEQRKTRLLAIAGAVGCLIMVLTSASSGPVITLIGAIGGLFFWRFRRSVRKLFWGFCVMLVVLHLVMKAPVWALLGRATVISGSTGYHRYILVDNFIRRFGEWWLLGTKSTDHWGYDLWDITNGYVDQGVNGGLVTFSLFIVVLAFQSRALGAALRLEQLSLSATRRIWAIGCCFFALLLGFFGVTLWGPARVLLYLVFALIAAECGEAAARAEAETLDEGWPNEGAGPSPAVGPEVSS